MPSAPVRRPRCLSAPTPGWTTTADVIVVGSGIAGLTCALQLRQHVGRVLLVTKTVPQRGVHRVGPRWYRRCTRSRGLSGGPPEDTLVAGVGLCDVEAVRVLVTEGPQRVREIGRPRCGVRSHRRWRDQTDPRGAGTTATGSRTPEVTRPARRSARPHRGACGGSSTTRDRGHRACAVVDLLTDEEDRVAGTTLHVIGEDRSTTWARRTPRLWCWRPGSGPDLHLDDEPARLDRRRKWRRRCGPVRGSPISSSSSSIRRSRGSVRDRPGSSHSSPKPSAVRAHLVDRDGVRSTQEPARTRRPRALAMWSPGRSSRACGKPAPITSSSTPATSERNSSRNASLDRRLVPIPRLRPGDRPAAGRACAALRERRHRRPTCTDGPPSSVSHACGECSCTGVHGANRLASNSCSKAWSSPTASLADIPARIASGHLPAAREVVGQRGESHELLDSRHRLDLQRAMTAGSGPVRSADSTAEGWSVWPNSARSRSSRSAGPKSWETTNLLHLGRVSRCSPVAARGDPRRAPCLRTSRSATTCVGCATRASP